LKSRLRAGMASNGVTGAVQETIVHSITAFALYGFPESHAASFALLAYASAYLKCHYLAAFTCAMLKQPADGVLLARRADQRCAAARPACAAGGRDGIGLGLYRGGACTAAAKWGRRPGFGSEPDYRLPT